jgi:hypothetical protein
MRSCLTYLMFITMVVSFVGCSAGPGGQRNHQISQHHGATEQSTTPTMRQMLANTPPPVPPAF